MNRFSAWTVHSGSILVGGTGLFYAWMRYFANPVDEFSVVNHPWQPHMQHLHLWFAPVLVFGIGLIWNNHVLRHYSAGVRCRRRSGVTLLFTCAPMVISGYLIQTAVGEGWRNAWIAIHLTTSALFIVGYAAHQLLPLFARRRPVRRVADVPAVSP